MKTTFFRRTIVLVPLACIALYAGCDHTETEERNEAYADVIYVGAVTDEAMVALGSVLDQQAPVDDPGRAPQLDAPTMASLPKSPIPTFQWHFGASTMFVPTRSTVSARALALFLPAMPKPSWSSALGALLGPPRAAHAHGDPLNGTATLLTFSTAADSKVVRVFTDQTSYQPAQADWDKLVGAGAEITLSLVAADFDNNRIAGGGAPVQGTKFAFTITP